jgi:hypothetical protein
MWTTGTRVWGLRLAAFGLLALGFLSAAPSRGDDRIDIERVKALAAKKQKGVALTPEEQKYFDRAVEQLKKEKQAKGNPPPPKSPDGPAPEWKEEPQTGLIPLCDMGPSARYKEQDGGLYGGGQNDPPKAHQRAAEAALQRITPLDAEGKPSPTGKIVFLSLGMSNAAGEFMVFKELADKDPDKSPDVTILNGAVGGAGVRSWTRPQSGTWLEVDKRLKEANLSPAQVQVAWIKHAEAMPDPDKVLLQYAKDVRDDIARTVPIMQSRFPNLRIAYFSSRTYGGYNAVGRRRVNPEPFAYETAFSVRWVIQDQINGKAHRYDRSPVLLWGPYLWADGIHARKDGLTWVRNDFTKDGVHPTRDTGGRKVAGQLLKFFKENPNAKPWFVNQ